MKENAEMFRYMETFLYLCSGFEEEPLPHG